MKTVKSMDERVLNWLHANQGKTFASPRDAIFGTKTQVFKISSVHNDRVYIKFGNNRYEALPLVFSMFDRVLDDLTINKGKAVRLGAKVEPPYDNESLEAVIWKQPYPVFNVPYKASPHVCDILCLAGLIKYVRAVNPKSGRKVQAAKLIEQCRA